MLLLCRSQGVCTEHITETVENDVVIEAGVTILVRILGIPTRGGVQDIFTITYQIDRLAIGHTILVNHVSRRVVDNLVVSHKTFNLRTENLGAVPVGTIGTGIGTAEDGLRSSWHLPALLDSIENI